MSSIQILAPTFGALVIGLLILAGSWRRPAPTPVKARRPRR